MNFKRYDSSEGNVFKYVFEGEDFIAESVLYRYESFNKRTVICCSTQSGCPVGCKFCGTGNRFIRNLTSDEIVNQIKEVLDDMDIDTLKVDKLQFMFMSMGEPLLNFDNVNEAIRELNALYPNAQLLLSTIAPKASGMDWIKLLDLSGDIDKVGLQFSIHKSTDEERNILIPYKNKYSLREIRDIGTKWCMITGRNPYLNYCVDGTNNSPEDAERLMTLFPSTVFNFTFSVVCSNDETLKDAGFRNLDAIREFENIFLSNGYNCRISDPAGQDDIGGGCGQLWYVQKWMKEYKKEK